jgi:hypothetical protein
LRFEVNPLAFAHSIIDKHTWICSAKVSIVQEVSSVLGFLFFANPIAYCGLKSAAEMRHAMVGLRGEAHDILMMLFYPI